MSSLAFEELKSNLNTFVQSLETGATTPDIIARFRQAYPKSIAKARTELEDTALTKLVNAVGTRKPVNHPGEPDLFSGFSVPNTIVLRDESGQKIHTPLGKVTIADGKTWGSGKKRPPQPTAHQIEVLRLIEKIQPYAKDENTTIEAALIASKLGEEKLEGSSGK